MKTMAETNWHNPIHFLGEATTRSGNPVLMLAEDENFDRQLNTILCVNLSSNETEHYLKEALIPTGRRFLITDPT